METLGAIALILLVLACPLGMLAIGGVAWAVARARGQKKDFSAGCMGGHGGHAQDSTPTDETALKDRVSELQAEVELLKAQLPGDGVSTDR
ncbi:MAG: hypothetical protein WD904_05360 [Dehalococcoidia bacterium]